MVKAIPFDDARRAVLAVSCPPPRRVSVPLAEAQGRYLAEAIVCPEAWPATDRSAMDGFAVAAPAEGLAAGVVLPVVGQSLAGHPFAGAVPAGAAVRIMTGAVVPAGASAVVPVEQTSGYGVAPGQHGAQVTLLAAVRAGQHIRRAGSELAAGTVVLAAGRRLHAAEIGVLAVLGRTAVLVAEPVRVAIVATGDEVVPVEQAPLPHQVRESNSWALAAQVREVGGVPIRIGIAPDAEAPLRAALAAAAAEASVLLTIGGVSAGTHDLVPPALQSLGFAPQFHGVELKPGKPTWFGVRQGPGAPFAFGLPGNPASAFTVFDLLVRPLLLRCLGSEPPGLELGLPPLGAPWQANARLQAIPAALRGTGAGLGVALAAPTPSGDPFGLLHGDVYALVPGQVRPGAVATLRIASGSRPVWLP
jgi:molybdopterin molybdotransferase